MQSISNAFLTIIMIIIVGTQPLTPFHFALGVLLEQTEPTDHS